MGKITMAAKSKKAEDVEGLTKLSENSPTPSKTAPSVSQHPSPTPRYPLTKTKGGCCRRACLFSLGVLVVLILFVSTACLVDYQQGNLATHTSQLPKEVREFPRQVGKYMVEVLYQTPKDLHRLFDEVLNWTRRKNGSNLSKNNLESQKLVLEEEILLSHNKEGELSNFSEEGVDDLIVDDGLEGVTKFFVGILKDVASLFKATKEEERNDSGSSASSVEIISNAIDRKVDVEESSEIFEMTQPGVINIDDTPADQVHGPEFFEHTTENEDDWNDEVIQVMEEIKVTRDDEIFRNILHDDSNRKQHYH